MLRYKQISGEKQMDEIEKIAGRITSVMFNGDYNVSINTDKGFQLLLFIFSSPYSSEKECRVQRIKQESSEHYYTPAFSEGDSGKWFKGNLMANKSPKESRVMSVAKKLNKYLNNLDFNAIHKLKSELKEGDVMSFIGDITVIKR